MAAPMCMVYSSIESEELTVVSLWMKCWVADIASAVRSKHVGSSAYHCGLVESAAKKLTEVFFDDISARA